MPSRFDWFAWDRRYREDDWFTELTPGEKWAYVAVISWANETDFTFRKCSLRILATNVWCDINDLTSLMSKCLESGKITDNGDSWTLVNGYKYRNKKDDSAAERMRRKRERDKDALRNSDVTPCNVTECDAPLRNPVKTKTETKTDTTPMSDAVDPLYSSRAPEPARTRDGGATAATESCSDISDPAPPNPEMADAIKKILGTRRNGTAPPKTEARQLCDELCELVGAVNANDRTGIWVDFQAAIINVGIEAVRGIIGSAKESILQGQVKNPIGLVRAKLRSTTSRDGP